MSEMKPTRGPWSVVFDQDEGGAFAIVSVNGINVALTIGGTKSEEANARLIAEAGTVFHECGLSPRQLVEINAELVEALVTARQMINGMKAEAETAAQGDEQMMLEACETISNEGLQADMDIRAALTKASASTSKG